jgi:DNA-binding LacI/PurR family transcriptional regulator
MNQTTDTQLKHKRKYSNTDNSVKRIGVLAKDRNYSTFPSFIDGIKEYANQKDYKVIITSSYNDHENEKYLLSLFTAQNMLGFIIDPVVNKVFEVDYLYDLKTAERPLVLLDEVQGIKTDVVKVDHRRSIKKMVKYLLGAGHTKIVLFSEPIDFQRAQEQLEGFKQAFSESPVMFKEEMNVQVGSNCVNVYHNTLEYFQVLKVEDYPTAVVCFNDFHALSVMSALRELKIRVPQDISVTGNADIFYSKANLIPLTTIRIPQYEMGIETAKRLINKIESSTILNCETIEFETELIIGSSTRSLN